MAQVNNDLRSRMPKGATSKRTVPLRLTEEEHAQLEALAERESRSLSSMALLIHLRSMAATTTE
jgi:DNA-binding response OmpR family regulator